jgi:3-deoxy-manno-octulosonate cytidylyltransferase (CMP-KDO synthetase)
MNIVAVIPARYASSRFPGKPLVSLNGYPLIWWAYRAATLAEHISDAIVATDDRRIVAICDSLGMKSQMTRTEHQTGTDRVAEVSSFLDADLVVNVQGDEPTLKPETINKAIAAAFSGEPFDVINCATPIRDPKELHSPTVPKVVVNARSEAVFLSRAAIPYGKTATPSYLKQVCVYVFSKASLLHFSRLPRGIAESIEDIEILRGIENRMIVRVVQVDQETVSVDVPSDLERASRLLNMGCGARS